MWFPVDLPVPSEHFVLKTQTSQSTTPTAKSVLLPLSWRTLETKSSVSGTQDSRTVNQITYAKTAKRNIGLAFSPSAGLWFSGLFNEEKSETRNIPDSGAYVGSGAHEEFIIREGLLRAGFDVTSTCVLGIALRGQSIKGDVLGNFSAQSDDRTIYTGQRMGLAAATVFTMQSVKIAARYEAPVTGKVSIAGESKVSSAPGYLGAAVNLAQSADTHLRVSYGVSEFAKNELGVAVRGPNKTRQFNIVPLGLAVDARLLPLSVLGGGIQQKIGNVRWDADIAIGRMYFVSDSEMIPPASIGDSEKLKMYSARMGLSFEKSDWESQVFIDYATMNATRSAAQINLQNTSTQWGVGLRAGIEI